MQPGSTPRAERIAALEFACAPPSCHKRASIPEAGTARRHRSRTHAMYGRRPTLTSLRGMVAAAHPLAAQAGARLLASGGNAFDAAAATAAALNLVEPYMSGFGGMGLAICYVAAERRLRVLDFVTPIPS